MYGKQPSCNKQGKVCACKSMTLFCFDIKVPYLPHARSKLAQLLSEVILCSAHGSEHVDGVLAASKGLQRRLVAAQERVKRLLRLRMSSRPISGSCTACNMAMQQLRAGMCKFSLDIQITASGVCSHICL